jgi:hypothetical protein
MIHESVSHNIHDNNYVSTLLVNAFSSSIHVLDCLRTRYGLKRHKWIVCRTLSSRHRIAMDTYACMLSR